MQDYIGTSTTPALQIFSEQAMPEQPQGMQSK